MLKSSSKPPVSNSTSPSSVWTVSVLPGAEAAGTGFACSGAFSIVASPACALTTSRPRLSKMRWTLEASSANTTTSMRSAFCLFRMGTYSRPCVLASVTNCRMCSVGMLKNLNGRCSRSMRTSLVLPRVFFWSFRTAYTNNAKFFAAMPDSLSAISVPSSVNRTI